jgi:hypothetical protein
MPNPASPSSPKPPGETPQGGAENASRSPVDEQLHDFWRRYREAIIAGCGIVLLFYVGKAGWTYHVNERQAGIQREFALATTPDKLQTFATAHPDDILGGIAQLMVGDEDSTAGKADAAIDSYNRAYTLLKTAASPLAARAQLGLAMAQVQSGKQAEGEAALHQLADDTHQFQIIRAEALYQLASLAASAGRGDEVQSLAMQIMQTDPNSPWAQRVFELESTLPPSAAPRAPAVAPAAPAIQLKPAGP